MTSGFSVRQRTTAAGRCEGFVCFCRQKTSILRRSYSLAAVSKSRPSRRISATSEQKKMSKKLWRCKLTRHRICSTVNGAPGYHAGAPIPRQAITLSSPADNVETRRRQVCLRRIDVHTRRANWCRGMPFLSNIAICVASARCRCTSRSVLDLDRDPACLQDRSCCHPHMSGFG